MNTDTPETDSAYIQRPNEGAWDFRVRQEKTMEKLERERDEAREYADKLAEGLPDGMLPKDVEVLREANLGLATNIAAVTAQRDRLAEALRNIMTYRKGEKPYDYWRLPFEERENAAFDGWMQIENNINQALQSLTSKP